MNAQFAETDLLGKELALLSTMPEFGWLSPDDLRWIWRERHNHIGRFTECRHGFFTLRQTSRDLLRKPTADHLLQNGFTHMASMCYDVKRPGGQGERPLYLFFIDIALAQKRVATARICVNRDDGNQFAVFDWMNPATRLIARRFEL